MVRIFVSHSSKDLLLTKAICVELSRVDPGVMQVESTRGINGLVDYENLQDGQPWPKQLHEWLARCHAGLIVLTQAALASDWVLKEATILTWRQSLDDGFKVFIAYDTNDVTDQTLKANRYGPLSIRSIQRIDSLDAATIAARVRQGLGPAKVRTPFERLVGKLSDLMNGKIGRNTLETLAERLRVDPLWDPAGKNDEQVIEEIARRLLNEDLGGFNGLDEIIEELATTVGVEPLKAILDFLAPYWVDAEVAGRLRALSGRQPPGAAALNTSTPAHASFMYVRRAHDMGLGYMLPELAGGDAGQTAAEISKQICNWFRSRKYANPRNDDASIKKEIAAWKKPVYALLPERVDFDVLDELRREFTNVIFVMPTGSRLEPDGRFVDVDWLEPALDPAAEERERRSYNAAVEVIRNK
jgi:TIR domain-containing protein